MYGSDLPNNSFEGQLFFLENNEENNFVIDDTMSPTSTNPVQNKVIYEAINSIKGLPSYTTSNDGQILRIVNGVPAWSAIPIAEEANF